MKNSSRRIPRWAFVLLCASMVGLRADTNEVAAPPAVEMVANPLLVEFTPLASAFVNQVDEGIDPFFPTSSRRVVKAEETEEESGVKPDLSQQIIAGIELKGIMGTDRRRIALINNRTFEVGESAELRTTDGTVRIRCEAITASDVVITILDQGIKKNLTIEQ